MSTETIDCGCMTKAHDGSTGVLTTHLPHCPAFGPELRALVSGLTRGMEAWAADEDGVHPDAWDAYQRAKLALGEPVRASDGE